MANLKRQHTMYMYECVCPFTHMIEPPYFKGPTCIPTFILLTRTNADCPDDHRSHPPKNASCNNRENMNGQHGVSAAGSIKPAERELTAQQETKRAAMSKSKTASPVIV